jgi:Flp pilus assembly secretin CpaC
MFSGAVRAESAAEILEDRAGGGTIGAGVTIDYQQVLFERVLEDLRRMRTSANLRLRAPSFQEEQELLATPVTLGPLRGVTWETAVDHVADRLGLVVDRSQFAAGVIYLEKMPRFTGTFDGARFGEVVREIARVGNANIIFSALAPIDSPIYLTFTDVPWREALESLIGAHNCTILYDGDNRRILRVATIAEGKTTFITRSRPLRYIQPAGPHFRPEIVKGSFDEMVARKGTGASDTESLISILKTMSSTGNSAFESSGGEVASIQFDTRTNTLIIRDTQQAIAQMMEVIDMIDQPPQQVLIETRIITMEEHPSFKLGVKWGNDGSAENGYYDGLTDIGPTAGPEWSNISWPWAASDNFGNLGGVFKPNGAPAIPNSGLSLGTMSLASLKFALQAAQYDDSIRITQAPQILVLDNEEASVFIGSVRTYALAESKQTDNTITVSINEKELLEGTQLLVIPHVCRGTDQVILEIVPKQSDPATLVTVEAGVGNSVQVPASRPVKSVHTKMMLRSTETGVIAGLIGENSREEERKMPGISKVPVIGKLFQHKTNIKSRHNTMVLVTPTIIPPENDSLFDQDIENFKNSLVSALR